MLNISYSWWLLYFCFSFVCIIKLKTIFPDHINLIFPENQVVQMWWWTDFAPTLFNHRFPGLRFRHIYVSHKTNIFAPIFQHFLQQLSILQPYNPFKLKSKVPHHNAATDNVACHYPFHSYLPFYIFRNCYNKRSLLSFVKK